MVFHLRRSKLHRSNGLAFAGSTEFEGTCALGSEHERLGAFLAKVYIANGRPWAGSHLDIHILRCIVTQGVLRGNGLDILEILVVDTATRSHRLGLLELIGIQRFDGAYALRREIRLVDGLRGLINRDFVNTDRTIGRGSGFDSIVFLHTFQQRTIMVDVIIGSLIFVQVGMVVGRRAGMRTIDTLILPWVWVGRIVGNHIAHRTGFWFRYTDVLFLLVFVPVGIFTICPVRAIGIDKLTIHDVQLAGLEVIGSRQFDGAAVDSRHRRLQLGNTCIIGLKVSTFFIRIATTERNPTCAVLIDYHTWVEDPIARQCTWGISVDHGFSERWFPGTDGRIGRQHANAVAGIGKIKEEFLLTVFRRTPGDWWCPWVHKALIPWITRPCGTKLSHIDGAVEGPVDHIVGGEDNEWLDISITILTLFTILNELLMVVRTIDIQTAVILEGGRICTEYATADGVGLSYGFEVLGSGCLSVYMEAHSHHHGNSKELFHVLSYYFLIVGQRYTLFFE